MTEFAAAMVGLTDYHQHQSISLNFQNEHLMGLKVFADEQLSLSVDKNYMNLYSIKPKLKKFMVASTNLVLTSTSAICRENGVTLATFCSGL